MKRILIVHSNMEIGGAETSLIGLLHSFDYSKVKVDLFLLNHTGEVLDLVPKEVNLLSVNKKYQSLDLSVKNALLNYPPIAITRVISRVICVLKNKLNHYSDYGYIVKQYAHYYSIPFLPKFGGVYDLAISFIDPHFILTKKVNSKNKIGWFHTDFASITPCKRMEKKMWSGCDWIVNVSESTKKQFDLCHKEFVDRSLAIENILSYDLLNKRSKKEVTDFSPNKEEIKILSIGRFCEAKNFDNVPIICKLIREKGLNVKWYIIGYGGDEELVKAKIKEHNMEDYVIILGKKDNPYPYIRACDVYIQPSRYEGKSVAVREAQMLNKPVVITNYATSSSQLDDGFDGVIVPMDNESCAQGIVQLLKNPSKISELIENTKSKDYSNSAEVEKLYKIMGI